MTDVDVIPGIFEKEWDAFVHKVELVAPYTFWVHADVLDDTLAPGETVRDFSGLVEVKKKYPNLLFEAHLVVDRPEKYLRSLVDAGFSRIVAHVEANDPRAFLDAARYEDVDVGLAIDGATQVDQIEPFLEEISFVVVMSAEAGDPDQPFLPEAVEKLRLIHQNLPDLSIEADGGITDATAKAVTDAGATRLVSTSFLFGNEQDIAGQIELLRSV